MVDMLIGRFLTRRHESRTDLAECEAIAATPLPVTPGHQLRQQIGRILRLDPEAIHPDPERRADAPTRRRHG